MPKKMWVNLALNLLVDYWRSYLSLCRNWQRRKRLKCVERENRDGWGKMKVTGIGVEVKIMIFLMITLVGLYYFGVLHVEWFMCWSWFFYLVVGGTGLKLLLIFLSCLGYYFVSMTIRPHAKNPLLMLIFICGVGMGSSTSFQKKLLLFHSEKYVLVHDTCTVYLIKSHY